MNGGARQSRRKVWKSVGVISNWKSFDVHNRFFYLSKIWRGWGRNWPLALLVPPALEPRKPEWRRTGPKVWKVILPLQYMCWGTMGSILLFKVMWLGTFQVTNIKTWIHLKFTIRYTKGQLISKAIYGLLTSPKNRTDEFVFFAFLLFMANKSNSSVRFLGESTFKWRKEFFGIEIWSTNY